MWRLQMVRAINRSGLRLAIALALTAASFTGAASGLTIQNLPAIAASLLREFRMALIQYTQAMIGKQDGTNFILTWATVTSADWCQPASFPDCNDKSIQALGTFDSGSVALKGANDGNLTNGNLTNGVVLRDPSHTTIAITSAGLQAVLENTLFFQPVISGGGGNQSLTIEMLVHQTQPLRL